MPVRLARAYPDLMTPWRAPARAAWWVVAPADSKSWRFCQRFDASRLTAHVVLPGVYVSGLKMICGRFGSLR